MDDKFDYAVDRLLNSRHVEPWISQVVFAHSDGVITEEQVNYLFGFPSDVEPGDPVDPKLKKEYPDLYDMLRD